MNFRRKVSVGDDATPPPYYDLWWLNLLIISFQEFGFGQFKSITNAQLVIGRGWIGSRGCHTVGTVQTFQSGVEPCTLDFSWATSELCCCRLDQCRPGWRDPAQQVLRLPRHLWPLLWMLPGTFVLSSVHPFFLVLFLFKPTADQFYVSSTS